MNLTRRREDAKQTENKEAEMANRDDDSRHTTGAENSSPPPRRAFAPSREAGLRQDIEEVAATVVDTALQLHRDLGPGLLESAYEAVLARMLEQRGLQIERQKPVPIRYQGMELNEGFRLDLLVEGQLVVELKSVEILHPVHPKQLLTYLRLMDLPLGLLINFGAPLLKDGLRRVVNKHTRFGSSRLRVHQNPEDHP